MEIFGSSTLVVSGSERVQVSDSTAEQVVVTMTLLGGGDTRDSLWCLIMPINKEPALLEPFLSQLNSMLPTLGELTQKLIEG